MMRRSIRLTCVIFLAFMILTGCSNNQSAEVIPSNGDLDIKQLTIEEKLEDFQYLYNIMANNYPYFETAKQVYNVDWLANKESYENEIRQTTSDKEYFKLLSKIIKELQDGHTDMLDPQFYAFIKDAYNGIGDSEAWQDILSKDVVTNRYGNIEYKGHAKYQNLASNFENIRTVLLNDGEVAYLSIESFKPEFLDEAKNKIPAFLKSIRSSKALIIDIRKNEGGANFFFQDLIVPYLIKEPKSADCYTAYRGDKYIEQFLISRNHISYKEMNPISELEDILPNIPKELTRDFKYYNKDIMTINPSDNIGYDGDIYLLVSNNVFSASDAFAAFAKSSEIATLIGSTTGGEGYGIDPAIAYLPNSGYVFRFPLEMSLNPDGSNNAEVGISPDYQVDPKVYYNMSEDKCILKAMELSGLELN